MAYIIDSDSDVYELWSDGTLRIAGFLSGVSGVVFRNGSSLSDFQTFSTQIPTGIDEYFIQYPYNFESKPKVNTTLEVVGEISYITNVKSVTTSGYYINFSDIVQETGVIVHTKASIN